GGFRPRRGRRSGPCRRPRDSFGRNRARLCFAARQAGRAGTDRSAGSNRQRPRLPGPATAGGRHRTGTAAGAGSGSTRANRGGSREDAGRHRRADRSDRRACRARAGSLGRATVRSERGAATAGRRRRGRSGALAAQPPGHPHGRTPACRRQCRRRRQGGGQISEDQLHRPARHWRAELCRRV
ncbi:hypothetical protein OY671_010222, partial [Metschnikowia pulcherrima]